MKTIAGLLMAALLAGCATQEDRDRWKLIGAALAVGAVAYAAARGGGAGAAPAISDYDWDWDQFYNQNYQLVWACRGVQSGQFADDSKCAYKIKSDYRWPQK